MAGDAVAGGGVDVALVVAAAADVGCGVTAVVAGLSNALLSVSLCPLQRKNKEFCIKIRANRFVLNTQMNKSFCSLFHRNLHLQFLFRFAISMPCMATTSQHPLQTSS